MALDALAGLLRALSDPCRLRLLLLCARQPASVSALAAALGETEPTVSRHLKALAAAGVLRRRRRGQRVEYSLAPVSPFDEVIAATLCSRAGDDALLVRARARLLEGERVESAAHASSLGTIAGAGRGGGDEQRLGEALALALAEGRRATADQVAPAAGAHVLLSSGRIPVAALRRLSEAAGARLLLLTDTVAERTAQRRRLADAGLAGEVQLRGDLSRALAAMPPGEPVLQSCLDLRAVRSWAEVESTLRWLQRLPATRSADWLLFDYDVIEGTLGPGSRNPPVELRTRLASLGFDTRRIQPIEADGHHRLFVHCVPRSADAARAA